MEPQLLIHICVRLSAQLCRLGGRLVPVVEEALHANRKASLFAKFDAEAAQEAAQEGCGLYWQDKAAPLLLRSMWLCGPSISFNAWQMADHC